MKPDDFCSVASGLGFCIYHYSGSEGNPLKPGFFNSVKNQIALGDLIIISSRTSPFAPCGLAFVVAIEPDVLTRDILDISLSIDKR